MPPFNYKGMGGDRHRVASASKAYTSGTPTVQEGYAGVPLATGLAGTSFNMMIEGEFALLKPTGTATRGNAVFINDATDALALAGGVGLRELGRITRVAGDEGVPTGYLWCRISPSVRAVAA